MPVPSIELVEKLIDVFERSCASELEFSDGGFRCRIVRNSAKPTDRQVEPSHAMAKQPAQDPVIREKPSNTDGSDHSFSIDAFMHGVFHRASAPGAEPFVAVGSAVIEGQQVGILEAMKVFMPVLAVSGGTIAEIHAASGAEVAPGQPLMTLSRGRLKGAT